jgi:hypothetical protein
MKVFVNIVSTLALVLGVAIAFYSWQAPNIIRIETGLPLKSLEGSSPPNGFSYVSYPGLEERQLGLEFGFGLAFLGAFGLYTQVRVGERVKNVTESGMGAHGE